MANRFEVTVLGDRAAVFRAVFGSDTVPVLAPLPEERNLDGLGETLCYMLDLSALTDAQYERLVNHLSGTFGATDTEVRDALTVHGLPIRAAEAVSSFTARLV